MEHIQIEGVTPSAQLRAQLAGTTVLLSFSRGKDSVAAWLALRASGVNVIPFHMYLIPDLQFVQESLDYFTDYFQCGPILNVPHPSLNRWLNSFTFQPPERCQLIQAAQLPSYGYSDLNRVVREHFGLPDAWITDGVRAADSPNRRRALTAHGPINNTRNTQKVVWDWRVGHVREAIAEAGVQLPPDYQWFKRSFDGLDYRFLAPLAEHAPDDYQRILDWFPLADLELRRAV